MVKTSTEPTIECPKCHHSFAITNAVEAKVRAQLDAEFEERSLALKAELEEKGSDLQKELEAKDRELSAEKRKAAETIASEKASLEKEIAKRLESSKKTLEAAARSSVELELKEAQQELEASSTKLREAQAKELDLRKQQRALEDAKAEFELTAARKLDDEREKIKADVEDKIGAAHELKALEWQKKQGDMEKLIEELRRKSEQGSQQAQGEVLELEVEAILRETFPQDSIEPVAKGVKGGDVLQRVMTRTGQPAGSILFELKRTKNWSDAWPSKLKDDQRAAKAELAILITTAMPEGVKHIGQVDGIWVTDLQSFQGLALALRTSLLDLAQARGAAVGKNEKMESLYGYLSGTEFRGRVEAIVEAFTTMKEDLEAEKRAIEKSWARRDKQISRVISSTSGMYGDLSGIIGASLPEIQQLTLDTKDE